MINDILTSAGYLAVEIKSPNLTISPTANEFNYLITDKFLANPTQPSIGVALPVAELQVTLSDFTKATQLLANSHNLTITIQRGHSKEQIVENLKFKVTNLDISLKDLPTITFYATADLGDFITQTQQKAYPDLTSIETLKQISSIPLSKKTDLSNLTTNDTQTWIQHNTTDYHFICQLSKHINLPSDLLLFAINDQTLRIEPYLKSLSKKPDTLIQLGDKEPASQYKNLIVADTAQLETSHGLLAYSLTQDTKIPILNLRDTKVKPTESSLNLTQEDNYPTQLNLPTKIDTGNTHPDYWNAYLNNQKAIANIYNTTLYITTTLSYLGNTLELLDTADFKSDFLTDHSTPTQGAYLVAGVACHQTKDSFTYQLTLCRASFT